MPVLPFPNRSKVRRRENSHHARAAQEQRCERRERIREAEREEERGREREREREEGKAGAVVVDARSAAYSFHARVTLSFPATYHEKGRSQRDDAHGRSSLGAAQARRNRRAREKTRENDKTKKKGGSGGNTNGDGGDGAQVTPLALPLSPCFPRRAVPPGASARRMRTAGRLAVRIGSGGAGNARRTPKETQRGGDKWIRAAGLVCSTENLSPAIARPQGTSAAAGCRSLTLLPRCTPSPPAAVGARGGGGQGGRGAAAGIRRAACGIGSRKRDELDENDSSAR